MHVSRHGPKTLAAISMGDEYALSPNGALLVADLSWAASVAGRSGLLGRDS